MEKELKMYRYVLSENYGRLYDLVMDNYEVAAWIEYKPNIFDICLIKLTKSKEIDFGVRGLSYLSIDSSDITIKDFVEWCTKSKIKYIEPCTNYINVAFVKPEITKKLKIGKRKIVCPNCNEMNGVELIHEHYECHKCGEEF